MRAEESSLRPTVQGRSRGPSPGAAWYGLPTTGPRNCLVLRAPRRPPAIQDSKANDREPPAPALTSGLRRPTQCAAGGLPDHEAHFATLGLSVSPLATSPYNRPATRFPVRSAAGAIHRTHPFAKGQCATGAHPCVRPHNTSSDAPRNETSLTRSRVVARRNSAMLSLYLTQGPGTLIQPRCRYTK